MKGISQVPSHEEYFGLNENYLDDDEFYYTPKEDDDDKLVYILLMVLVLLQEFYEVHRYDTASYVASDTFKSEVDKLNVDIKDTLHDLIPDYLDDLKSRYDLEYLIPSDTIDVPIEWEPVFDDGVDSITNQLYHELVAKASYYTNLAITTGVFSVHADFRRTIRRIENLVRFNGEHCAKLTERHYLMFVYGQDALFDWICSGINTCDWCYMIQDMCPLPLSQLPVDHIHGNCIIRPHNQEEFSEEYLRVRMFL